MVSNSLLAKVRFCTWQAQRDLTRANCTLRMDRCLRPAFLQMVNGFVSQSVMPRLTRPRFGKWAGTDQTHILYWPIGRTAHRRVVAVGQPTATTTFFR